MKTQESTENYLEAILILEQGGRPVRSVDIAVHLGYSRPSVSAAVKKLTAEGFVEVAGGTITLTKDGREIAETMYERHIILSDWLISLGVDKQTAVDDACRIEHVISKESFDAIKNHLAQLGR
ncbi:MAG: metal-dependent transcriptional regulator [Defluviitaleaceae bacterium]|nr:metal-dependent transcriptional regulator [Defluviitaleaceae bacterium]